MYKPEKFLKDHFSKLLLGRKALPKEAFELADYIKQFGPITFTNHLNEDGSIVSVSQNFQHGSIVAYGKNERVIDDEIIDAIYTAFSLPSAYRNEVQISKIMKDKKIYATA